MNPLRGLRGPVSLRSASWAGHWERLLRAQPGGDPHVPDIAGMLDLLPLRPDGFAPPGFRYLPVRSAGNAEMSFDQASWADAASTAAAFGVGEQVG